MGPEKRCYIRRSAPTLPLGLRRRGGMRLGAEIGEVSAVLGLSALVHHHKSLLTVRRHPNGQHIDC